MKKEYDGTFYLVSDQSARDPESISYSYDGIFDSVQQLKTFSRAKICRRKWGNGSIAVTRDAQKIFFDSWNQNTIEHKESFKMLLLNRANKVLGITTISEGGLSGTVTDVRLIYQYAIKGNASGIIVAHNHPSGNINSSESDQKITQKIKEAGNLLDIQLLDHIIITPEREIYRSFADEGQL